MDFTLTPKEELKYASESISQSIALGIDSLGHFTAKLAELLPDIIRGIKGSENLAKLPKLEQLDGRQKSFVQFVAPHSYMELREIRAFVPEGFQGTFLELLARLDKAAVRCQSLQADILNPYVVFLAHLVSSGDALKSMDDHAVQNGKLRHEREALYTSYGELFSKHDTAARRKLGLVIERVADWEPILSQLNVVLSKLESIKRADIDHLRHQAEDYLDILFERLEKGQLGDANPEVCKALADGAYQIGCELEFFSVAYFWVLGLKGSIENTMEEVQRVLK